jgi:hypothetical protein
LGFAYAVIFFLGNTYVYFATTPVQPRKLFPFMAALMLAPFTILAVDSHTGDMLLPAMFFTPFVVAISAFLNPRSLQRLERESATNMGDSDPAVFDWKTELGKFVGQLVWTFLILLILRAFDSRQPHQSLAGWLEVLALVTPVGLTIMMIAFWFGWRDGTRRTHGGDDGSDPAVFDWKTRFRRSALDLERVFLYVLIFSACDRRYPHMSLVDWIGLLVFMVAFGFTFVMIWFWIGWKVGNCRRGGSATRGPEAL